MRRTAWLLTAAVSVVLVVGTVCWNVQAQQKPQGDNPREGASQDQNARHSVQDALLRPLDLPFDRPTSLEDVARFLREALGAQVILDRAALDRLDLVPEATVQLELKGVRLKTGLNLLLDQVGLTYRVEPEDNLLILTDAQGSGDTNQRILSELKALHRDV